MSDFQIRQQPAARSTVGDIKVMRVSADLTSTATANISWVNPEGGTVAASVRYFVTGSAGTGAVYIGVSDDGTGSAAGIINGGTLTSGVHMRPPAASSTAGAIATDTVLVGPGGTGTNNSIVAQLTDTATSTMGGLTLEISYSRIDPT